MSEPTRKSDWWVLALKGIAFQASWPHESRALSRNLPRQWRSYNASRLIPVKSSTVFLKRVSKSLALASFPIVYAFTCAIKGAAVCWRCSRAPLLTASAFGSFCGNLVDPASSHMLVSKIKPCMSQYRHPYGETANSSLKQL